MPTIEMAAVSVEALVVNPCLRKTEPSDLGNVIVRRKAPKPRPEPQIAIIDDPFSEKALLRLIDDCIAPALVDIFLRDRLSLPDPRGRAHNVDQP